MAANGPGQVSHTAVETKGQLKHGDDSKHFLWLLNIQWVNLDEYRRLIYPEEENAGVGLGCDLPTEEEEQEGNRSN